MADSAEIESSLQAGTTKCDTTSNGRSDVEKIAVEAPTEETDLNKDLSPETANANSQNERKGEAKIKAQYLLVDYKPSIVSEYVPQETKDAMKRLLEQNDLHKGKQESKLTEVASEPPPQHIGCVTDEDVITLRPEEKKKINFSDKLYLAPLTTVGNLPFRRICKTFGADVTCSEMAVATSVLQGKSEWALLKRHKSEDIFGIQLCGSHFEPMTRCAQLIQETCDVDFIDINCGCPIELIFQKGEGCALMGRSSRLGQIVRGMKSVLEVPLTLKMRTGISDSKNLAHTLIPKLRNWGVDLVTVHGRSREQRYTKLADWDYIRRCSLAGTTMPVFGNGDVYSFEDANHFKSLSGVSGLMVARGALIKPWIFTEIKEQRHWDISSSERMDILRQFVNNGFEHWGSDHQGVETTRRFLLEWLSFLHRYIPVGILERVPQKINERPPYYFARDELETLMASSNCGDWIKISEMLLGPVPDNFVFLPKHKANAYK
ncbi:DUS3 [Acanthosepion pharaonis]|uniref:tRNA-dihydrouridine(47) synthase [NAD(P)(+)] n=1 Tax=Acanthosepion pharaonis TaxID=158019 RepID=A0A812C8G3_ACAPH|nr:DUS3 [Sepia pharaonis]